MKFLRVLFSILIFVIIVGTGVFFGVRLLFSPNIESECYPAYLQIVIPETLKNNVKDIDRTNLNKIDTASKNVTINSEACRTVVYENSEDGSDATIIITEAYNTSNELKMTTYVNENTGISCAKYKQDGSLFYAYWKSDSGDHYECVYKDDEIVSSAFHNGKGTGQTGCAYYDANGKFVMATLKKTINLPDFLVPTQCFNANNEKIKDDVAQQLVPGYNSEQYEMQYYN